MLGCKKARRVNSPDRATIRSSGLARINNQEGDGSKSEKLAKALENSQPIIIVTIQTFPFVLKAIEDSVSLKERNYVKQHLQRDPNAKS